MNMAVEGKELLIFCFEKKWYKVQYMYVYFI